MENVHLLTIEHTVAAYQAIAQETGDVFRPPWLEQSPVYLLARCPFCQHANTEKINTYSLRGWWHRFVGESIGAVVSHCDHFALTQAFVNFHGHEPPGLWGEFPPEVPHVLGYLYAEGWCQAVIHALPICRMESDQFIPAYTAYLVTHFSQQPLLAIHDRILAFNIPYIEEGLVVHLINPPPGNEDWYDLAAWVARGQLWWVDATDPALPIRTGDVAAFPYQHIRGRMWSHQFLTHGGPTHVYREPRR